MNAKTEALEKKKKHKHVKGKDGKCTICGAKMGEEQDEYVKDYDDTKK